jgi:hypothetical protein
MTTERITCATEQTCKALAGPTGQTVEDAVVGVVFAAVLVAVLWSMINTQNHS